MSERYISSEEIDFEENYIIELGDGSGRFEKDALIEAPEDYQVIVVQNGQHVSTFGMIPKRLNSRDIPGLKTSLFNSVVECGIYYCKVGDRFNFTEEERVITLKDGSQLAYAVEIADVDVVFEEPVLTLANILENPERDFSDPVLLTRDFVKDFILLSIDDYLIEHLEEQEFYDDGEINKNGLDTEFLDFICDLEILIEDMFADLGIKVELDINDLATTLY